MAELSLYSSYVVITITSAICCVAVIKDIDARSVFTESCFNSTSSDFINLTEHLEAWYLYNNNRYLLYSRDNLHFYFCPIILGKLFCVNYLNNLTTHIKL